MNWNLEFSSLNWHKFQLEQDDEVKVVDHSLTEPPYKPSANDQHGTEYKFHLNNKY